jgi:hypothetical protein
MQTTKNRSSRLPALVIIAVAILGAPSVNATETTVNFSATPVPTTGTEQKNPGFIAEITPAPEADGRNVFRIAWPAYEGFFVAGYIDNAGILIERHGKYRLTAKICAEQLGPECPELSLRLIDKNWETYQVTAKITPGEPGWMDVSWTLDTEDPKASGAHFWGGADKELAGVVNLPVRLRGFGLSFTNRKTPGGVFLVEQVKAMPVPATR